MPASRLLFLIAFAAASTSFGAVAMRHDDRTQLPGVILTRTDIAELRDGDLIFRKATGVGSDYILSVDDESAYSHVGLIRTDGNQVTVIHASFDQEEGGAIVHEEVLDSFLYGIPLAATYRLHDPDQDTARRAVAFALENINRPFDFNLDLSDPSAFYCTELVWAAYKHTGIDLLDGHFDELTLPFLGEGDYILPSSLAGSRWLGLISVYNNQP